MKKLLLLFLGKNPERQTPDVLDIMFAQPHLTMRQAHWKVNRKRIILRWVLCLVLLTGGIYFFVMKGG